MPEESCGTFLCRAIAVASLRPSVRRWRTAAQDVPGTMMVGDGESTQL